MRITLILGSPRRQSYSSSLAESLAESLSKKIDNGEVRRYALREMEIRGIRPRHVEKRSGGTMQPDDCDKIVRSIAESDIVIFSTPVYFGYPSSDIKAVWDRMYPMLDNNGLSDKIVIVCYSQMAQDADTYNEVFQSVGRYLSLMGVKHYSIVSTSDPEDENFRANVARMKKNLDPVAEDILDRLA